MPANKSPDFLIHSPFKPCNYVLAGSASKGNRKYKRFNLNRQIILIYISKLISGFLFRIEIPLQLFVPEL